MFRVTEVCVIPTTEASHEHEARCACDCLFSPAGCAWPKPMNRPPTGSPRHPISRASKYPQVDSKGRVRARVVAPDAQSVQLDIGAVKYPLTKGDDGAWIGESRPQDEGFHYYQIILDGAQVPDPNSLYFYGANRWGSGVEVPAKDQDFYALKNVPHGQLRETLYYSKSADASCAASFTRLPIMKKTRRCVIPCCICSTVAGKMKLAGAGRGAQG